MSSFKPRGYKKLNKKLKGYRLSEKYTPKEGDEIIEIPINMESIENMTDQDVENHLKFLIDMGFVEKRKPII